MTVGIRTSFRDANNVADLHQSLSNRPELYKSLPRMGLGSFKNAVIVRLNEDICSSSSSSSDGAGAAKNVTAKVFTNGFLHFTGSDTLGVVQLASDRFVSALTKLYGGNISVEPPVIQMINTSIHLISDIDLVLLFPKLIHRFDKDANVLVELEKDKHPGIKISMFGSENRKTTAMIFNSGCILLTGLVSTAEFEFGSSLVLDALETFPECLHAKAAGVAEAREIASKRRREKKDANLLLSQEEVVDKKRARAFRKVAIAIKKQGVTARREARVARAKAEGREKGQGQGHKRSRSMYEAIDNLFS